MKPEKYIVAYATYNRNESGDALCCGVFQSDYPTEKAAHDAIMAQIRAEIAVQLLSGHAQDGFHLCLRLTFGAVDGHAKGAQDGEGREDGAFLAILAGAQKPQGEVGDGDITGGGEIGLGGEGTGCHALGQVTGLHAAAAQRQRQHKGQTKTYQLFHVRSLLIPSLPRRPTPRR